MKKVTNCSENWIQKVFVIFIFLTLYILTGLHAQDTGEGKIGQDLNSESEDEISALEPSPEKAQEEADKKQSLEELLAVPFNQIKEEQALELGFSEAESSDNVSKRDDGEVKLPPPPQQRKVERDIEKKIA